MGQDHRAITLTLDAFWQFSVSHYQKPGVEAACLTLQDHYQGNVNLALFLIYLEQQQYQTNGLLLNKLLACLHAISHTTDDFRRLRRQLKPRLNHADYQALLDFELSLEKQQQATLIQQWETHVADNIVQPTSSVQPASLQPKASQAQGLALYCAQLGAPHLEQALHGQG
ncbi:TIGR02444 family protein [Thaumasiovibrio subtropicus]|uniref:TIGR02444 family protein n=1 Tax=Thaumasiovibrio subtropicus TaxID=1891207 RepID=UPI000B363D35|nr:TIGR02444 family protein [Thaumasiovibrio subtropicus]